MSDPLILAYLTASEEQIARTLGRILIAADESATFTVADDERVLARVTEYLNDRYETFRRVICSEWKLDIKVASGAFASNADVVAAIADLIAPFVGAPPAAVVATLLFKRGIQKLCQENR